MLELIKPTKFDFMGKRFIAYWVTSLVALAGIVGIIAHHGPRLSIDFTGGTLLEVRFTPPVSANQLRSELDKIGYEGAEIQEVGNAGDIMIRTRASEGGGALKWEPIQAALAKTFPNSKVERLNEELVGPKIGGELKGKALWAIFWSLGLILLYVGVRYDFRFAVGGVLALFHDLFIVFGLCVLFDKEFSLTVLAAFLTLAGYSINDTVVVFDRIREVMSKGYRREDLASIMNTSINQTLSRTIITALTVFLSVLALYLVGGQVLHDFAFAMLVGVVSGTYSSIFVASAFVLDWTRFFGNKKPVPAAPAAPSGKKAAKSA